MKKIKSLQIIFILFMFLIIATSCGYDYIPVEEYQKLEGEETYTEGDGTIDNPYVEYYGWSINCIDDISVDMNHALLITSSGVRRLDLTGSYSLNSRIFLYIHLTITE